MLFKTFLVTLVVPITLARDANREVQDGGGYLRRSSLQSTFQYRLSIQHPLRGWVTNEYCRQQLSDPLLPLDPQLFVVQVQNLQTLRQSYQLRNQQMLRQGCLLGSLLESLRLSLRLNLRLSLLLSLLLLQPPIQPPFQMDLSLLLRLPTNVS
jgi:hypothetical protein